MQEEISEPFLDLLTGAMEELSLGDPWDIATDIGPIISETAAAQIGAHVDAAADEGRLLHQCEAPEIGSFVGPALIGVPGIEALKEEIFGPVLHVAKFKAEEIDRVIATVNATGYGLTFGLHTRIDDRMQAIANAVNAGNIYANRNQIGAMVGSQPFGGEGLSGTGPKAGGPHYLARFTTRSADVVSETWCGGSDPAELASALRSLAAAPFVPQSTRLPGPTGELNRLTLLPRPPLICAGPGSAAATAQRQAIEALGGHAISTNGTLDPKAIKDLPEFGGLVWWGDTGTGRAYAQALALRDGPITPLLCGQPDRAHACLERHLCVDTTAAGGQCRAVDR